MRFFAALLLVALVPALAQAQPSPPGFSKAYGPDTIGPGSVTTLTFRIDNSDFGTPVTDLAFVDNLPAGVTIATPAEASTTCGPGRTGPAVLSAPNGGGTITFSNASVLGFSICEVTVNVTSSTPGTSTNVSGDLTSSAGNSGTATDDLTVDTSLPGFTKSFSPSSVPLGGRSTLTFTIDNTANASNVLNLDFTDNLPGGMEIADPANASTTCGTATIPPTLTANPGGTLIVLDANGTFAFPAVVAGATCSVAVDVVATAGGQLGNVTDELLADFVSAGKASAVLTSTVTTISLAKSFTDDPAGPGASVTLDFTISNFSRDFAATSVAFTDDLDATLTDLTFDSLLSNDCGGTVSGVGTTSIMVSGATVAASGTCTISTSLSIPGGATPGSYPNTTTAVTGDVGGSPIVGNMASDVLFVASVPLLSKEFTDDPVTPGSPVTLEFTIQNTSATSSATDLEFIDPLGFLGGTLSMTFPPDGFCGPGSEAFQTTFDFQPAIQVTGGSLDPGASCTFSVTIDVPEGIAGGTYTNTTEPITGTVDGASVTGNRATDDLVVVAGVTLVKAFTDDPVLPGGTVTLEFTIEYPAETGPDATAITFTDDLDAALSGLASTSGTQNDVCGTGSSLSGTSTLSFTGGTLMPGESCTFSATLDVPAGAAAGTYTNTTSTVDATIDGSVLTSPAATDDLRVSPILFSKDFTDDPVMPGGTATLEFTIENTDAAQSVSSLFFSDNLDAVLSGMASTSGTQNDVCGSGSTLQGTTQLFLFGGTLGPGASCTFSVTVSIPGGAGPGTYTNVTSDLSGDLGGSGSSVLAPPATAELEVAEDEPPGFTKAFSPDEILTGGVSTLTLTIDNAASTTAATALDFTDNLPAGLVVATPANASTDCTGGTLTAADGSGTVSYTGGTVGAGASCTVSVDVTAAAEGEYVNETGDLTSSLGNSGTATATLTVVAPPDFSVLKTDEVATGGGVQAGGIITYTVELVNSGGRADMELVFSDTPGTYTTLVAGSVTTTQGTVVTGNTAGDTSVEVNAGLLGPSASVTIQFDVVADEEFPIGVEEVCNQGSATDGEVTIPSDDPDTPAAGDPTCTPLDIPRPLVDAVITEVQGERGAPFRVIGTLENTTEDQELIVRAKVTLTGPNGETFTSRSKAVVLDPGEIVGPASAVRQKQIPNFAPAGTYTGILEIIQDGTMAILDVEEFEFTLPPLPPEIVASAAAPGEAFLTVLETRLPEAGPNPFSRQTTFRYALAEAASVTLRVYDATGREVAVLADEEAQPGEYERVFDGGSLPAGVYLWRATVGEEVATGRVTLLR